MERFLATISLSRSSSPLGSGSRSAELSSCTGRQLLAILEDQPGVIEAKLASPSDSMTVLFDRDQISLPDVVWLLEQAGASVSGIVQRSEQSMLGLASA